MSIARNPDETPAVVDVNVEFDDSEKIAAPAARIAIGARDEPPLQQLIYATDEQLIAELLTRGPVMAVLVSVDRYTGRDSWHYAVKGSPIILGAMSAALSMETRRILGGIPEPSK